MEPITSAALQEFFEQLGRRYPKPAAVYLLGGSALCLLGSPRTTLDVDYDIELAIDDKALLEEKIAQLAEEMRLDVEAVPLAEFAPLPAGAHDRRRPIGRFAEIDAYIFDLYSIALSKIARGFESDLEDVLYLLRADFIDIAALESCFHEVLPRAALYDIDPREFRSYFDELRRRHIAK